MSGKISQDLTTSTTQAGRRYVRALLAGGKRAAIECALNYVQARDLRERMDRDPATVDDTDFAALLDDIVERHEERWEELFAEWEEHAAYMAPEPDSPHDWSPFFKQVIITLVREALEHESHRLSGL